MKYDFDRITDRRNTDSLKYDFASERGMPEDLLPMWVADMDFPAPPEVIADIHKTIDHGIFGYTEAKQDYYDALINWFSSRFDFLFEARDVLKMPGVVFALAAAVKAFTEPGDGVLIQTPVYYPFYEVIEDNGRKIVSNPLLYNEGRYSIDFDDFERKISENDVRLFILCSPHNPIGRVWTREELERLNKICVRHDVVIVSDEIHCDFVYPGNTHTCFGLINNSAVIQTAPSKTFNLAGLQTANTIVKSAELRRKLKAELAKSGYSQLNAIGIAACKSAYTKGGEWLEALKSYLAENVRYTREFLDAHLPKVKLAEPQGTYLLWLDFSAYGLPQDELDRRIINEAKLWFDSGTIFGAEGEGFQRINIACPKATLEEALNRLKKVFG